MSKSIWVGRVGRFEQRPREKVFFCWRQLSNVSYLSATKLQHEGDFCWLQKIGKPPLCDFNSERALTLPTGNSLWQQMILLTSVGCTAFHDPWCPRPHTQVAQLWGRQGSLQTLLRNPFPPLAKRGGGGGPAHAMCQGGCMQPYGRGDSCNVAWHCQPFNRQLISFPHHIL